MKCRSFENAREFVHTLNLKSWKEWLEYSKSGKKPEDIPINAYRTYKKEWKDIGDWLGTGYIASNKRRYCSFEEAKKFVHKLGLKNSNEWSMYCKSGKKPEDIPRTPYLVYNKEWKGMDDWLGTGRISNFNKRFRSFEEAREFIHTLNLISEKEWRKYRKSEKKPKDIPTNPNQVYKKEWKGMGDWLGTGYIATYNRKYRPYEEAREFVHTLTLQNSKEWSIYCKSGKKPNDIPADPYQIYKKEWKGMGDWLGTGYIATYNRKFRSFEEAREFVHTLGLMYKKDWEDYCQSGNRPEDIPSNPNQVYKKEWRGITDWLGSKDIVTKMKFISFEEAREFVHTLGLMYKKDWEDYKKSGELPKNIPRTPDIIYKKEWKGMGDWLGTGYIATYNRKYRPYEEAREFVHTLNLKSWEEWREYCNSGKRPKNIPAQPSKKYPEWTGIWDWLGFEGEQWSINKIKDLLKDLIKSGILYDWTDAVLYSFLLRKGLLNLHENNRHKVFMKNIIEARRTFEGRQKIENYVNSDIEEPPRISNFIEFIPKKIENNIEENIGYMSSQELLHLPHDHSLSSSGILDIKQILKNTSVIESFNIDEEAIQFYVNYSINELWKNAFKNGADAYLKVRNRGKNGNKYHDLVVKTFLSDFESTQTLQIPKEYTFPQNPTLMQLYVSYKMKTNRYFGNFSGTGAGKTLSSVLASRVNNSKMTIVVCPNDVVEQWQDRIIEIFSDSLVTTKKEAFFVKRDEKKYQYLVLNYDKFSLEDTPNLLLELVKQKIDFIILDEVHFVKKRDENSSKRRTNLEGLLTAIRKRNSDVKILALSATPVVNNLNEGRSLLELMTGKVYDDISTSPTISNAVTLYEKLSTVSVREMPQYDIDCNIEHIEVNAQKPQDISIKNLKRNPLEIEQFLTDARIDKIIQLIKDQTIIYTEYITNVVEKIEKAVKKAGFTYALYTGQDHSGKDRFIQKRVQVLIASKPISTGVDGLQHICNRLIINTLPWTNAQFQQLVGRLVRRGQFREKVDIFVIKANISGYPYDQLKWNRIEFKRTLADCAIDGTLPEKNLVTPQQAAMEAVKWLERLERGEISSVIRQDLNVQLTPFQIQERINRYGDFSRLNQKINSENSSTTHKRLTDNPEEWKEYHRQYMEARKEWTIIPYEEIIKRIKELSPRLQIGDFGCGEAKILQEFGNQRVYSFDHVAINDDVISCDMKAVPISDDSLDIAVFSLSLMGKNWSDYIKEAKRCLATNGYLLIVETTKSFRKDGGRFNKLRDILKDLGFEIYVDEEKGDFTFIEARSI